MMSPLSPLSPGNRLLSRPSALTQNQPPRALSLSALHHPLFCGLNQSEELAFKAKLAFFRKQLKGAQLVPNSPKIEKDSNWREELTFQLSNAPKGLGRHLLPVLRLLPAKLGGRKAWDIFKVEMPAHFYDPSAPTGLGASYTITNQGTQERLTILLNDAHQSYVYWTDGKTMGPQTLHLRQQDSEAAQWGTIRAEALKLLQQYEITRPASCVIRSGEDLAAYLKLMLPLYPQDTELSVGRIAPKKPQIGVLIDPKLDQTSRHQGKFRIHQGQLQYQAIPRQSGSDEDDSETRLGSHLYSSSSDEPVTLKDDSWHDIHPGNRLILGKYKVQEHAAGSLSLDLQF